MCQKKRFLVAEWNFEGGGVILCLLLAYGLPVDEKLYFGKIGIYLYRQQDRGISLLYATTVCPVTAGNVQYGNVLTPGRLIVIIYIFRSAVGIHQSFVIDARHGLVAQGRTEVDEIPVGTAANVRGVLQYRKIVLKVFLLVLDTEIKRTWGK